MQQRFRELLADQPVPWVEVHGTVSERLAASGRIIDELIGARRFADPLDAAPSLDSGDARPLEQSVAVPDPGSDPDDRSDLTADDLFTVPAEQAEPLDEKLRQAYFWLVNSRSSPRTTTSSSPPRLRCGSPSATPQPSSPGHRPVVRVQRAAAAADLRRRRSVPAGRRAGRGKTAIAVCMGVLAGSSAAEVRRHVQHGQPQLTVADLVGIPLPRDLVAAERSARSGSPGAAG